MDFIFDMYQFIKQRKKYWLIPVLFILMITILSLMAGPSFGASSALQLNLIVFFGIPVMAIAFILFLDIILGGEE